MENNGRTVPAPIFNHRKRPRQAIMSDPQDAPKGPTTPANMYQDLMPVQGFQSIRASSNQSKRRNENFFQNNNRGGPGCSATFNQTTGNNRTTSSQQKPFLRNDQNQTNSGGFNNFNKNTAPPQSTSSSFNRTSQYQNRPQTQQHNNYNQKQQGFQKENNYRNMSNFQQNAGQQRRVETQTSETRQNFNQFYRSPPQRHTYKKLTMNKPNRSLFDDSTEFEATGPNTPHSNTQSSFSGNRQNVSSSKPTGSNERTSRKTKVDIDNSLHVISTSIKAIRHWSKYKDKFPMLFEVYGIIDSALLRDKTSTGKEFVLRDEQDSIQCIFYEIDRQLPRLIRGQWHRCVGNFDSRLGQLKCVSVRPVTRGDERQVFKSTAAVSDNYLKQMTKSLPEP